MSPNHPFRGDTSIAQVEEHAIPSPCAFIDRTVPPTEVVLFAIDGLLDRCEAKRKALGGPKHSVGLPRMYAADVFDVYNEAKLELGRMLARAIARDAAVTLCTMPDDIPDDEEHPNVQR